MARTLDQRIANLADTYAMHIKDAHYAYDRHGRNNLKIAALEWAAAGALAKALFTLTDDFEWKGKAETATTAAEICLASKKRVA
jgi:hypothetical protein